MPLDSPRLDDRAFKDIVEEALRRIPQYTPEWTDHNLSDPGITLIELFAWMVDILLYRLNRVPDRHYVKLMNLLGMELREPQPAKTDVTMWLSAPQPIAIIVQAGTEVATTRTENDSAVVFSTDEAFTVRVAELNHVMTSYLPEEGGGRKYRSQNLRQVEAGFDGFNIFQESPKPGDAVYFGFRTDLSYHILGLSMEVDLAGGAGIDPTRPPYEWQALSSVSPGEWTPCELDEDGTKGFNVNGLLRLHLPKMAEGEIDGRRGFWVRCRLSDPKDDIPQYRRSPRIQRSTAASWGGTMPATNASKAKGELLGRSDGTPGQTFYLENVPVLAREADERILVRGRGREEVLWNEVPDFSDSKEDDLHYTLDNATGEIRFGPALPQRDGTIERYGQIPERSAMIVMQGYRYGGGSEGNVQKGALNILKTSIPYIARVLNRQPASGGLDIEDIENAKMRVPSHLRSLNRAVTARDYEYLSLQSAPGQIARVFALQPPNTVAGEVKVLVIPRVNDPKVRLELSELELDDRLKETVRAYLDTRRLLTTRLDVTQPAYYWISTRVRLRVSSNADEEKVKEAVSDRLFEFINPIIGGGDGEGWQFGRDLFVSDIFACLQTVSGIDFVRSVDIYPMSWQGDKATRGESTQIIETVAHGVVVSYRHDVRTDDR